MFKFKELDPLLHSQLRLSIMTLLMSVEEADFVFLKEKTKATSGNLSVQIEKLNEANYIEVDKFIDGKKPRTVCRVTKEGIDAFNRYVEDLNGYFDLAQNKNK